MIDTLIKQISNSKLQSFFQQKISSFRPELTDLTWIIPENGYEDFSELMKLGEAEYPNSEELLVFSCHYNGELTERSSKKKQFELAKRVLKEDFKDGAIFVFYGTEGKFRFSFIRKNYGDQEAKLTPWRRFTYYVDPDKNNKTFVKRIGKLKFGSLDEIQDAFSVEPLSKSFYKELSHWYFYSLTQVKFPNDQNQDLQTLHTNAMIRLITRIMFVWFMKQKGLVPDEFFSKKHLDEMLNYKDKTGSTYYKAILQNLFFATLNTPREKGRIFVNRQYGIQNFYRYKRFIKDPDSFLNLMDKVPFLNGGLFENLDVVNPEEQKELRIDCFSDRRDNEERLCVPDHLFFGECEADISSYLGKKANKVSITGLIDLLYRYDFTIDENTPFDQEVALDPEMLGLVFENLLASFNPETEQAARKESGSFYTPRVIVDYMVEETLIAATQQKTGLAALKLKLLIKDNNEQPFESLEEKEKIVKALSELRVIDPACGSGAFPMGALQKMVHVLSMVDPENELWEERQREIAIFETAAAYKIGNHEERKLRLNSIERAFENSLNDPDYARKLFLIENCLYGVDIQPIALQISKLRFFISLLVDQKIDLQDSNYGVLPLPNLETKFVAANSLIHIPGFEERARGLIRSPKMFELEDQLNEIRKSLFNARTTVTKEKQRKKHLQIQNDIADELIFLGYPNQLAEAIKEWKAFNANYCSDWFDPDWMFGVEGFDVVIGNPPYIQLQKALPGEDKIKYADLYKNEGYQTFERTGDIYALFYERGVQLLNDRGYLCFITSNKWMRAKYGKSLRQFLTKVNPRILIDLGPGIFEAATVDTNILLLENTRVRQHSMKTLNLASQTQISAIDEKDWVVLNDLSNESWIILEPEELTIKEKIERLGTPLKEWDVQINRGILTGYNPAFIIDGKKKDELIAEDPKSAEILKPILRGRDIKRYRAEFADLWLIAAHNGYRKEDGTVVSPINIKNYPAIKNWLDSHWVKIQKRYDKGNTPYNLRNCAY
ncbi:MAG: class I SAM-dependent DNA methyltransferase, partial [Saprospirales bacterium]